MKIIAANFKSNQTRKEAEKWIRRFTSVYRVKNRVKVALAPGFANLGIFGAALEKMGESSGIRLAAQDVSPFPSGAYTGAVNARQLKGLGVNYCLAGHSERRRWFGETNQTSAQKITELWDVGITPILCLDLDYAQSQIAAVGPNSNPLIIAYEPLVSIGNENPLPAEEVARAAKEIKKYAGGVSVIYGGSVNSKNAGKYLSVPEIFGLLVGTASLNPDEFNAIINQA